MNRISISLALLTALALTACQSTPTKTDHTYNNSSEPDITTIAQDAIVKIDILRNDATHDSVNGFTLDADHIVTILPNPASIKRTVVRSTDGRTHPVIGIVGSRDNVAILKVNFSSPRPFPLPLSIESTAPAEKLTILYFDEDLTLKKKYTKRLPSLLTSATFELDAEPLLPAESLKRLGAPVLDNSGQAIGIISSWTRTVPLTGPKLSEVNRYTAFPARGIQGIQRHEPIPFGEFK